MLKSPMTSVLKQVQWNQLINYFPKPINNQYIKVQNIQLVSPYYFRLFDVGMQNLLPTYFLSSGL